MKNARVGNPIAGNFSVSQRFTEKSVKSICKKRNVLFAKTNNSELELTPKDDDAELIVSNFSDNSDESIYTIKCTETGIVIVLYQFKSVRRIELESETQYFYLDRLLANKLKEKGDIKSDEVQFLKEEFLDGKSIFVIEEYQGKITSQFQMFGNSYRATCKRERPGVIKIEKISRYNVNNRNDEITQYFGNIKFITFDDSLQISGNDYTVKAVQTDDIFLAWEKYLDFKKAKSDEKITGKGFLRYDSFDIQEATLIVHFGVDIKNHPFFSNEEEEDEYDLVLYDESFDTIPNNIDAILEKKSSKNTISLGKCIEIKEKSAEFNIPKNSDFSKKFFGVCILSDRSSAVEQRRRKNIIDILNRKTNKTANMLMRLATGEEDRQSGDSAKPATADVLYKMFGDKKFKITENYRTAMDIALNTPDIALIQGPPGTGKTTLIKGIISRLNAMKNKNYKILVSSEQHEALYNVVEKLSSNRLLPPFISSKKFAEDDNTEDNDRFEKNVSTFQKSFMELCDAILRDKKNGMSDYSSNLNAIIYRIHTIRSDKYQTIKEHIPALKKSLMQMGIWDAIKPAVEKIEEIIFGITGTESIVTPNIERIIKKLNSQRMSIEAYRDDGAYQLNELQRLLKKETEYPQLAIDGTLYNTMQSGDEESIKSAFEAYKQYIERLKEKFIPKSKSDFEIDQIKKEKSFKELFDDLLKQIQNATKNRKKDFYDIVEELKYKLNDIDNISNVVRKYTSIIGSTCAQAKRSIVRNESNQNSLQSVYDYVIIDEAARVNPLDIMIPIVMGTRVILVGDQMQLPHFIEEKEAKEFAEEARKKGANTYADDTDTAYDGTLLKKSLFALLYEQVEKSYNEGKLAFQRHIRINEQHRMHPIIGDFISKQFYNGGIVNGAGTKNNINDFNIFNNKNVAWIHIPITEGMEEGKPHFFRRPEITKVLAILSNIVSGLNGRPVKIGIVSFYKKQVELINQNIREKFPAYIIEMIECNTVDSFQGKEFDIVILSAVRSNVAETAEKSLGFIHYSKSRINVALSRAKRLLIAVGDAETFGRNDIFKAYIEYVKQVGYYE